MKLQGSKEINQKQIRDVLTMNIGRPVNVGATHHQQVGSGTPCAASQQRPGYSVGPASVPGSGPSVVQGMVASCLLPFNKFLQVVL